MFKLYLMAMAQQLVVATTHPYAQIILRNMGFSQSIVGVIIALSQLASSVFPLLIGNIADKSGKPKKLYMIASSTVLISYFVLINFPKLAIVVAFFTLAYAFGGSTTSLSDSIINLTATAKGKSYSNVRALGTLCYVVTLTIFTLSNFPNQQNNKEILLAIVCASLIQLVIIFFTPNPVAEKKDAKQGLSFSKDWFIKGYYCFIIVVFFNNIAGAVIDRLLGSYMTEVLNLGSKFTVFVALGAFSEFIFMVLFGKMLRKGKITEYTLLLLSCIGYIVRLSIYALTQNIYLFAFAQTFHSLTYAASHVAMISFISKNVSKDHTSLATAIYASVAICLAQFIGSFGGGFIIDYLGYSALFRIYTIFPIVGLILAICFKKNIKNK